MKRESTMRWWTLIPLTLLMACSSAEGEGSGTEGVPSTEVVEARTQDSVGDAGSSMAQDIGADEVEGPLDGESLEDGVATTDADAEPGAGDAGEGDAASGPEDADAAVDPDGAEGGSDTSSDDPDIDEGGSDGGAAGDDTDEEPADSAVDTSPDSPSGDAQGDAQGEDAESDDGQGEDAEVVICADGDGDGYCVPEDCDDSEEGINPAADEFCGDDIDNNCDGATDEGCDDTPTVIDETTCEGAAAALTSAGCLFAPIVGNPSSEVTHGPLPWAVIAANANEAATDVTLYAPDQPCSQDVECGHCGDGVCNSEGSLSGIENSASCQVDCASTCGDEACTAGESNAGCPLDCPSTCGNGSCDDKENSVLCPADCAAVCGDHACTNEETPESCPADCGVLGASCTEGFCPEKVLETAVIEGGELHIFEIAGPINAAWELGKETGMFHKVFQLEATRPIVAYQFQPYSTSYSATADAALLLPKHAWGNNYLVLNHKGSGNTWVTIVALDEDVVVRVRMPEVMNGTTLASDPDYGGPVIDSMGPGEVHLIPLDAGQAVRIYATPSVDLSGMGIFSGDKDVAVMVGSPGTSLPGPNFVGYNDYLEEQLPPRTAWGKEIGVVKFKPISNESDVYRIMADKNGTIVTLTGDYEAEYALDEGEFVQFETEGSFVASASEAILVAHGMVSAKTKSGNPDPNEWPGWFEGTSNCGQGGTLTAENMGDPALSFVTPSAQYRNEYVFLTPYTYAWDVLTIVAPDWAWEDVLVDDLPLPAPTALAGSDELSYARFLVSDGPHHVESPLAGVGIEVYGYDCRLSYAYAGGLSLGAINEPPPLDDIEEP